ncbi:MAG: energy-coupling factor ABC transporter permease [Thermoplasmata archaeon]|jgi:cobalt/nickel transport system permease protein|nr:energy-coupling factor ABC transporter permease [Thermoplasmata archaeon]
MAHIHLEDGAFSPFWVIVWSLAAAGVISLALLSLGKGKVSPRKLAIAAMCTAVGFAVFQVSIPIFGGIHLNLTPMIGILAGPGLGSLSVLIINIFSAAVGHGGWGMIGANTLVNVTEVLVAYYVYRLMRRSMKVDRFLSGLTSGVVALTLSALLIIAIVVVSGVQDSASTAEETAGNMLLIGVANIVAGVIEGLITGYVVAFIGRTRPDLLADAEGATAKGTEG